MSVKTCCGERDQCHFCGCCQHTKATDWCKVMDAPVGMYCPNRECGCGGKA